MVQIFAKSKSNKSSPGGKLEQQKRVAVTKIHTNEIMTLIDRALINDRWIEYLERIEMPRNNSLGERELEKHLFDYCWSPQSVCICKMRSIAGEFDRRHKSVAFHGRSRPTAIEHLQ